MEESDFSVFYTQSQNLITVNSKYPSLGISFMVICFLGSLPNNISYELGNIETFLCNDSYYPYTSIGMRYSSIQNFDYIQADANCIRTDSSRPVNINNINIDGAPWVAFLDSSGIVRGPKTGIVANTTQMKYSFQYVKNLIQTLRDQWNSKRVSAGTVEALIPDILMHKTKCIDEQAVIDANRTIYNNLGPDPRNPLDPTRNKGLFPKCSSKSCFDSDYKSKFNGRTFRLHDTIFRINLMFQLAEVIMNRYQC